MTSPALSGTNTFLQPRLPNGQSRRLAWRGNCPLQSYRRCCPSLAAGGGTSRMGHTPEMRPACWAQFPGTELCTLHRRQTGVRGFYPLQELGSLHLETQKGDFSWNWWKQTGACSKAKHPSLNSNPASSQCLKMTTGFRELLFRRTGYCRAAAHHHRVVIWAALEGLIQSPPKSVKILPLESSSSGFVCECGNSSSLFTALASLLTNVSLGRTPRLKA